MFKIELLEKFQGRKMTKWKLAGITKLYTIIYFMRLEKYVCRKCNNEIRKTTCNAYRKWETERSKVRAMGFHSEYGNKIAASTVETDGFESYNKWYIRMRNDARILFQQLYLNDTTRYETEHVCAIPSHAYVCELCMCECASVCV